MIKNRNTTIAFIVASLAVSFFRVYFEPLSFVEILGNAVALMIGPALISLLVLLVNRLLRWKFDERSFFWTFLVVWIFFACSQLVVSCHSVQT